MQCVSSFSKNGALQVPKLLTSMLNFYFHLKCTNVFVVVNLIICRLGLGCFCFVVFLFSDWSADFRSTSSLLHEPSPLCIVCKFEFLCLNRQDLNNSCEIFWMQIPPKILWLLFLIFLHYISFITVTFITFNSTRNCWELLISLSKVFNVVCVVMINNCLFALIFHWFML